MSMATETAPRRRWFGLALFASLAVNLFLVGIVVGGLASGRSHGLPFGGPPRGGPDMVRGGQFHQLSEPAREKMAAILEDRSDAMRERVRAMRAAQRDAARVLAADTYDADKAAAALRTLRMRTEELQAEIHAALSVVAKDLSPEERARLSRTIFLSTFYGMPLADMPPPRRKHVG